MARLSSRRVVGRVGIGLGVIALVLAPLVVRVWIDGRAELARASVAEDADICVIHLGRAARFRLPLADHDELAQTQLRNMARNADESGDIELSLAAWRELRGALIGTRVVDVADPELLAEANAAIIELMVRQAEAEGRPVDRDRWVAELAEDPAPRGRSLLAAGSFVAWLATCIGFFARAIDSKGRLNPRPARAWGIAVLITLIAWILLM